MIKRYVLLAVCCSAMTLAACGGGSDIQSGPVPTPTPTPTPTPSPTPTPTPLPTLPLAASTSFDTIAMTQTLRRGGGAATVAVTGRSSATTVSYNAAANTYTVRDDTGSATFGAADQTAMTGYAVAYATQADLLRNDLKIYGNVRDGAASGAPPLQLSYVTYGLWTHSEGGLLLQPALIRQTYALIGFASPATSIPQSGSASYDTLVSALYSEGGIGTSIPGSATFSANFANGTILTDLKLGYMDRLYTGSGTISANQFQGTFSSPQQFYAGGSFAGGFFGPEAKEMGYVFSVHDHNPDPYAGAAVDAMDKWYNGVVLGVKK